MKLPYSIVISCVFRTFPESPICKPNLILGKCVKSDMEYPCKCFFVFVAKISIYRTNLWKISIYRCKFKINVIFLSIFQEKTHGYPYKKWTIFGYFPWKSIGLPLSKMYDFWLNLKGKYRITPIENDWFSTKVFDNTCFCHITDFFKIILEKNFALELHLQLLKKKTPLKIDC